MIAWFVGFAQYTNLRFLFFYPFLIECSHLFAPQCTRWYHGESSSRWRCWRVRTFWWQSQEKRARSVFAPYCGHQIEYTVMSSTSSKVTWRFCSRNNDNLYQLILLNRYRIKISAILSNRMEMAEQTGHYWAWVIWFGMLIWHYPPVTVNSL